MPFGLTDQQLEWLRNTLRTHLSVKYPNLQVWVFGSRARGDHRSNSDLDLLLENDGEIDPVTLALLREALEESSFPYKVDLVESSTVAESYIQRIHKDRKHLL